MLLWNIFLIASLLLFSREIWKEFVFAITAQCKYQSFKINRSYLWYLFNSFKTVAVIIQKPVNLLCKLMDWFLYDNGHRHERVKIMIRFYTFFFHFVTVRIHLLINFFKESQNRSGGLFFARVIIKFWWYTIFDSKITERLAPILNNDATNVVKIIKTHRANRKHRNIRN